MKKDTKKFTAIDVAGLLAEGHSEEEVAHAVWVHVMRQNGCTCDLDNMTRDPDCPINHKQSGLAEQ